MSTAITDVVAKNRTSLEATLTTYVAARRWFRSKSRTIARVGIANLFPLPGGDGAAIARLLVHYADGGEDAYVLPLVFSSGAATAKAVATVEGGALYDAAEDLTVLAELLPLMAAQAQIADDTKRATLRFRTTPAFVQNGGASPGAAPKLLGAEQTNTSVALGERFLLKIVRKLDAGVSPDLEMGEHLTKAGYENAPLVAGAIDLVEAGKGPATVAILSLFVKSKGDAWGAVLGELARWLPLDSDGDAILPRGNLLESALAKSSDSPEGQTFVGAWLGLAKTLGSRTGEMHLALVKGSERDDAFRPAPFDAATQSSFAANLQKDIQATFAQLDARIASLPAEVRGPADRLRSQKAKLEAVAAAFGNAEPSGARIRVHGDLHLGQVLFTGDDFVLIDFEGEPARPLNERRAKRSPLADVAGMLRSFHYAAVSGARAARAGKDEGAAETIDARALAWHRWITSAFLEGYLRVTAGASFLPKSLHRALNAFLLEKALYELRYELDNRPDWAPLPIAGLIDVASQEIDHAE